MTRHVAAPIDWDALADAIQDKRGDVSLRGMAAATGMSFSTISRLVRGCPVDLASYVYMCDWLDTSLDTFVRPGMEPGPYTGRNFSGQLELFEG